MNSNHLQLVTLASLALAFASCQTTTTTTTAPDRFAEADANHDKALSLDEASIRVG